ncbi:hypothetical protein KQX54_002205 [Cotesia glomerata]|uniref:Retrotransposon gag domain-containing protein n=1 Tax=Cotesia glomerata TaxID=32391 RepID=A0AAV7J191_COTGL|nr:hypothetical protein KQX54_002205 [Cotesia glomerata]
MVQLLREQNINLNVQLEIFMREKDEKQEGVSTHVPSESGNINSVRMKDLKSHLEVFTKFDGDNISVETFIFEIKSIFNEVPEESRVLFIRLIISKKIVRYARKVIDGNDIRSLEDLIRILRINFGENKSYDVTLLERSQCQQNDQSVLNYNKKFNDCHLNVKRALNNNSEFDAENRMLILKNEERQGLAQYVRGLRASIKLFVKSGKPTTIREAQNLALEIEKEELISQVVTKRLLSTITWLRINHKKTKMQSQQKDCPQKPQVSYQNFPSRQVPNVPPNQIKYIQCQKTEEIQEQASCSESTPPSNSEIVAKQGRFDAPIK